jgi:hypothetical protein
MIRDLRGVVEREGAGIGLFLTLAEPTKPMITEAAGAGQYELPGFAPLPRLHRHRHLSRSRHEGKARKQDRPANPAMPTPPPPGAGRGPGPHARNPPNPARTQDALPDADHQ